MTEFGDTFWYRFWLIPTILLGIILGLSENKMMMPRPLWACMNVGDYTTVLCRNHSGIACETTSWYHWLCEASDTIRWIGSHWHVLLSQPCSHKHTTNGDHLSVSVQTRRLLRRVTIVMLMNSRCDGLVLSSWGRIAPHRVGHELPRLSKLYRSKISQHHW